MKGNKIGPLKLHPINFCSKFWAITYSLENNWLRKKDLARLAEIFPTILGFQPIYFQFHGVTRNQKE